MEDQVYQYYEYRRSKQQASLTTSMDYKVLIDLALDNKDFRWAKELHEKMKMREKYKKMKESWGK